jgi:hypothetical protein
MDFLESHKTTFRKIKLLAIRIHYSNPRFMKTLAKRYLQHQFTSHLPNPFQAFFLTLLLISFPTKPLPNGPQKNTIRFNFSLL